MFVLRMLEEQAKYCSLCKEGYATGKEGERRGVLSVVFEMKLNLSVWDLIGSPERYPQKI